MQGFGYVVLCGRIGALDPHRLEVRDLLYFNRHRAVLGPMGLIFEIDDSRQQSTLAVLQDGYGEGADWDWYYDLVLENWPRALGSLKDYLERAEP